MSALTRGFVAAIALCALAGCGLNLIYPRLDSVVGFYLQDLEGDGDPLTSDGIFIYNGDLNSVDRGDVVRVVGTASDYQYQTQVSATTIFDCGMTDTVDPVDVTLPFADAAYLERFEGMLVRLPQALYVTEHFQLGRRGAPAGGE